MYERRPLDRTHCTASTSATELKEQSNGLHIGYVSRFKALMNPSAGSVCAANVGPALVPGRNGKHGATERALEGRAPNTTCSIRHQHISREFKEKRIT